MSSQKKLAWRRCSIGDLCKVRRGSSPRPIKDQSYFEGGTIPWIKIADATSSEKYLYDTRQKVNEYGASFSRLLPEGSLILAASGTLGYVQMLGVPGCIHDGWLHLYDFQNTTPDFLYYWLLANPHLSGGAAYGAAIQNINTDILRSFEIDLPPVATQQQIASILSAYDDLIENNTRRIKILEEMARRLYEEWFVHFRFPGHEEMSFKETELGRIPDGWEVLELDDVSQINPEALKPKSAPDEIHYIDIASVSPGRVDKADTMKFTSAPGRARRVVRSGDVLWSCVRPNRRSCAMIVGPRKNTVASTGFAVLRAWGISKHYLYQHVRADQFVSYLVNRATGAAYPAVKATDFKEAKIIVPQKDILTDYDKAVAPVRSLIHRLDRKNANLRAQCDLLLPKLISGEIDVSDIPIPDDKEVETA